jgi:hypothetical protein
MRAAVAARGNIFLIFMEGWISRITEWLAPLVKARLKY